MLGTPLSVICMIEYCLASYDTYNLEYYQRVHVIPYNENMYNITHTICCYSIEKNVLHFYVTDNKAHFSSVKHYAISSAPTI